MLVSSLNNKEKSFEVISNNNNKYFIKFYNKGNSLLISCYYQKEIIKFEYESEFDINYIKKVKLFTIYDSIDECLNEIFNIILIILLINTKFKEIIFEIKEKVKNDKQKIGELFTIINLQQKEIINLKNRNNNLKEKIIRIGKDL